MFHCNKINMHLLSKYITFNSSLVKSFDSSLSKNRPRASVLNWALKILFSPAAC